MQNKFDTLVPDTIFAAAERALERRFSGVLLPLPSYINRVYEMESCRRERFILKFYRPGRWSRDALLEEHLFTLECKAAEIPVVAPLRLASSKEVTMNSGSGSERCSPGFTPWVPRGTRRTGRSSPRGKTPCRKQRGC